jgi:hypothetical protein
MNVSTLFMAVVALGATTAGCALGVAIPVQGEPRGVVGLSGEWNGTYVRDDTQREGTIWFVLKEGEDHAHGDVRMTPQGGSPYLRHHPDVSWERSEMPGVLDIRFVYITEGGLEGSLEPYWDPQCRCRATTTFRGRLSGNRLSGTFLTRLDSGTSATGRWQATRTQSLTTAGRRLLVQRRQRE